MLKNRMVGGSVAAVAALAIPVVGVTALGAGPAAAKAPTGITCSKLSGTYTTSTNMATIKLKKCTGNTGASGKTTGSEGSSAPAVVKWANAKSTSFTETYASGSGCASGQLAEAISGSVTADNTKSTTVGAAVSATLCVTTTATGATFSLASGTKFVIAA